MQESQRQGDWEQLGNRELLARKATLVLPATREQQARRSGRDCGIEGGDRRTGRSRTARI